MNQQVIRDTTYKVTSRVIHIDTAVSVGTLAVVDTPITSVEVLEVNAPPIKPQLTAFDTIQPCDQALLSGANYVPLKIQGVRINEEKELPMNYDIPISGVVLAFTMYVTVVYLVNCGAAWKSLVDNIRKEMA
jgi:hypothetical protein